MTPQPAHDRLDISPFWKVQGVFDPDGGGADFSYTIGLATRGVPELHMWARPSLGEDPGEDWAFSLRDCCIVLNEFATLLLRGEISEGSVLTRWYDGGLATVEFHVDAPETRASMEAFGVDPDAEVLPVRWSLQREPTGQPTPLTTEAREAAQRLWAELSSGVDRRRRLPDAWLVPRTTPAFEPDERFGPLTPLVAVRGALLLQADAAELGTFLGAVAKLDAGGCLRWPTSHARAVARPVGRVAQLDALEQAVVGLVEDIAAGPVAQRLIAAAYPPGSSDVEPGVLAQARQKLVEVLRPAILACLSTQAVADVASNDLMLAGLGGWEASLLPPLTEGPSPWAAAPHVVDVVRRLLRRRSAETLSKIGLMHDMTLRSESVDDRAGRYAELESRLTGWALASPASCPPVLQLLAGTRAGEQLARGAGPGLGGSRLAALQEWATCVTSALTHRQRLTAEDVRLLAWPLHSVLPGLARIINEPI